MVDDEYHAIDNLGAYINEIPYLELIGYNTDPKMGLAEVNALVPDIVFLDMNMPDLSGIDFCTKIPASIKVVFVTGYTEYAFKAFENNAVDYLLKPVSRKKFSEAMNKILNILPQPVKAIVPDVLPKISYIYIKQGIKGKLVKIDFEDIYYIESNDNNVIFNLEAETCMAYVPLKKVIVQLPEDIFLRIHKSFIVNHKKISHIDGNKVVLKNKTVLQLGNTYRELFFNYIETTILKTGR